MSAIETNHDRADPQSVTASWLDPQSGVLARCRAHLQAHGAHPSRTLVLLPYVQLIAVARRMWATAQPVGFAPRFETTATWARSLGGVELTGLDLRFDAALDTLSAHSVLVQSGMASHAAAAAGMLIECAYELAPLAAAVAPPLRAEWGRQQAARLSFAPGPALSVEAGVAQTALAWVSHSSYLTDVLYLDASRAAIDAVFAVQGIQPDPMWPTLTSLWGPAFQVQAWGAAGVATARPGVGFSPSRDAAQEALSAAACVIEHVNAGRTPVALVAVDRTLTRRVRAMLDGAGLALRDETGWKLSTSRSAAHVMVALRACVWDASADAVLDWLKAAPDFDAHAVAELEARLRKDGLRDWAQVGAGLNRASPALIELLALVQQLQQALQAARNLEAWLTALRALLVRSGQWTLLSQDSAGARTLAALRLAGLAEGPVPADMPWAGRRLTLAEFTRWVDQSLESASFMPDHPSQEQVVILPMVQMLGRPFAAAVVAGCDEQGLPASPEPGGLWTAAQRALLGLPAREDLQDRQAAAWRELMRTPHVDLLWRCSDDSGEALLASPMVQGLWPDVLAASGAAHCAQRTLSAQAQAEPAPSAAPLVPPKLSASAYADLRHCPYRFFALRMLGLKAADELEVDLDKRDFGLWLHAALQIFHVRLQGEPTPDPALRRRWLDEAAQSALVTQGLAPDEFAPFQAAWPDVREGYLAWLAQHDATGYSFQNGEQWYEQALGEVSLVGKLDRVDLAGAAAGQPALVIDYKTESLAKTRERLKNPLEDTQLAFYAALLADDAPRAAYVNVSEREGTKFFEATDIVNTRDALLQGVLEDTRRLRAGDTLRALGEAEACEFCAARGLCRKDFWVRGAGQ